MATASMIDPTGLTTYTYDALNRLTWITNNKGQVTSFTYEALGRGASMTHANGARDEPQLRCRLAAFVPGASAESDDD